MTDEVKIKTPKETFLFLLGFIQREGANVEQLKQYLLSSDFFEAPASTVYHNSFEGGLCKHSLNVYNNLVRLVDAKFPVEEGCQPIYSQETLILVSLFHDLSKTNFYERYYANKKVYDEAIGDKKDEHGKFYWASVPSYKVKDQRERFVLGTHGQNSAYMLSSFIPLTQEETAAIVNHHAGMDNDTARNNSLTEIYNTYPLAVLLHLADMMATYIDERM